MNFVDFDIKNGVFLAPMAGITDLAFRTVARDCGAGLCYSEMISAKGLVFQDKKTKELLKTNSYDEPLSVQLFGCEPDIVGEAAKKIKAMGFKMIDINSGCPTPKIVNNGDGSALMKDPKLLGKVVEKTVLSVDIPVTVKIRTGYTKDCINAIECAKIIEASGAKAIAIHGRTREQFYSGKADYSIIKSVKEAVKIPVIGNGDIFSALDAENMLKETQVDEIMVGRGCLGNPFLFREIDHYFKTGELLSVATAEERIEVCKKHLMLAVEIKGEKRGILESRKHLAWYLKTIKGAAKIRNALFTSADIDEVIKMIDSLK